MTFDLKEPKVKKCKSIASKSSTILAKEVEFIKILSPSYLQGEKNCTFQRKGHSASRKYARERNGGPQCSFVSWMFLLRSLTSELPQMPIFLLLFFFYGSAKAVGKQYILEA